MPLQKVYFINFEGPTLTEAFIKILLRTAQEMFREKSEQKVLKNNIYEAVVNTKWRTASIGTIFGYEFSVKLECGNKTSNVKFLSRKTDLDTDSFVLTPILADTIPMVEYSSLN